MAERRTQVVEHPIRLDKFLVQLEPDLGRVELRQIVRGGEVYINGQPALKPGQLLEPGDCVEVALPEIMEEDAPVIPLPVRPLPVLYEDEAVLVLEKPAAMPARPSRRHLTGTLAQQIAERYPEVTHIGGVERGGIVFAVDEEISGLALIARNETAYRELKRRVQRERFEYVYAALVDGHLSGKGVIDQRVGNVKHRRGKLAVSREGRHARTFYRMQRHFKYEGQDYTLLDVRPETTRRHQIRVHLAWYGFPIVGDRRYGSSRQPLLPDRPFLHLGVLAFPHPVTGESVRVESALPAELYSIIHYFTRSKTR